MEKNCLTCKYGEDEYDSPRICYICDNNYSHYTPAYKEALKEEESLKGEFYIKVIYESNNGEAEIGKIKLRDFIGNLSTDMVDSIYKAVGMK